MCFKEEEREKKPLLVAISLLLTFSDIDNTNNRLNENYLPGPSNLQSGNKGIDSYPCVAYTDIQICFPVIQSSGSLHRCSIRPRPRVSGCFAGLCVLIKL